MAQAIAMVPTIKRSVVLQNGTTATAKNTAEAIQLLEGMSGDETLLSVMGGPGQNLFVRAQQMGLEVQRIPWFTLERLVPGITGASGEERARALKDAWQTDPDEFYPMVELDETILMLRELTRVRLTIQEYRKMATLQYKAAFRDLEPILPEAREFANLRTMFASSAMIDGAKADEKVLESRIGALARKLDIWNWLHPAPGDILPQVKGLGPALGGSLIGEIGDIKRFPTPAHLRSYARFGLDTEGRMPRRRRGEVSSWNRYLNRAVWLWSTDQVWRYDHVWKDMFHFFLYNEFQRHPEVVREPREINGETRLVTRFNLAHLYKRSQRKVGSQLLKYVWGLWAALEDGQDPEKWFRAYIRNTEGPPEAFSTWDHFLNTTIPRELDGGRREFVWAEIDRRRQRGEQTSEEADEE